MHHRSFCSLFATLLFIALTTSLHASEPTSGKLSFGWANESIVPNRPVAIGGQYHTRISGEVHDPISVTALALETKIDQSSLDQAVLVSCDLCAIRRRTIENVRKLVARAVPDLNPQKIIISATHTHTAPALSDTEETNLHPYDFLGSWAYRIPKEQTNVMQPLEYLDYLERQIALAVVRAWESRERGSVSSALGHVSVARNRRAVFFDGTTRMYGDTRDPNFSHTEGTSDDSLDVLCLWRDQQLVGLALTLYCPSQEVEGESYLSADFWADARRQLREALGSELFILSLTGASGDQSPHIQVAKNSDDRMLSLRQSSYRQEIGRRITVAVQDVIDSTRSTALSELTLVHQVEKIPLPVWQVSDERYAQSKQIYEAGKDKLEELSGPDYIQWRVSRTMMARYELQKTEPTYATEIHAVRLDRFAILTNPFELFADYSMRMKSRSPADQTSVIQLACDCLAYLPTERAVQGGGYSARIDDGVIGPEGGRVLVEESVRMLKQLWKTP